MLAFRVFSCSVRCGAAYILPDDLKVALSQQVQHFTLCVMGLQIEGSAPRGT